MTRKQIETQINATRLDKTERDETELDAIRLTALCVSHHNSRQGENMGKTIQDASAGTILLAQKLASMKECDVLTYQEIAQCVGTSNTRRAWGSMLDTARNIARREHKAVFGVLRAEGLKRLDSNGIVSATSEQLSRVHRTARKGIKIGVCADYTAMTTDNQRQYNTAMILLAITERGSNSGTIKKVLPMANNQVPQQSVLDMFKS